MTDSSKIINERNKFYSKVTVVLGAQWGDEGKGKVVDILASNADIVCRCQGGSNAFHKITSEGVEYVFHLLPTGIVNEKCLAVIGNGVVVHLPSLFEEIAENEAKGLSHLRNRLIISDRAHLVFDFHRQIDSIQEDEKAKQGNTIGTTKMGIGPTYACKVSRTGIRIIDLLGDFNMFCEKFKTLVSICKRKYPLLCVDVAIEIEKYREYAEMLRPLVKDTIHYLHKSLKNGLSILVEGANAVMLDVDFGTYPYVTSSNSTIGGVLTGLGLPPKAIGDIIGVVKSYTTRAGDGPFPTEVFNKIFLERGLEICRTTKRKRRCGWLDLVLLHYSTMVNGYSAIYLTKLDILDTLAEIKICVGYKFNGEPIKHVPCSLSALSKVEVIYETLPGWQTSIENIRDFNELPINARNYVKFIENHIGVPVKWIGVGRDHKSIITIR